MLTFSFFLSLVMIIVYEKHITNEMFKDSIFPISAIIGVEELEVESDEYKEFVTNCYFITQNNRPHLTKIYMCSHIVPSI